MGVSNVAKAVWNGTVIAETDEYETVEGNVYFPAESVRQEYLKDSDTRSVCPWKGEATYKSVVVNGEELRDAAWYYPTPLEAAANITGHYAFWKGVVVSA